MLSLTSVLIKYNRIYAMNCNMQSILNEVWRYHRHLDFRHGLCVAEPGQHAQQVTTGMLAFVQIVE